jgi:hypothetical protein
MTMHMKRLQSKRKEANFFAKTSTRIRMEGSKRKNRFIKDNIARNINTTSGDIKAFVPFVKTTIPKKSTLLRTELQLMFIVRTKVGPTSTTKNPKKGIVNSMFKKALHGSLRLNDFAREAINQVDRETLHPKT